jgi:hypothetical protein
MKTINVIASSEKNPVEEIMYVFNGNYGIESTHSKSEASLFAESIQVNLKVSHMFPGTFKEWNRYINECISDTLLDLGLAYKNKYDDIFIK